MGAVASCALVPCRQARTRQRRKVDRGGLLGKVACQWHHGAGLRHSSTLPTFSSNQRCRHCRLLACHAACQLMLAEKGQPGREASSEVHGQCRRQRLCHQAGQRGTPADSCAVNQCCHLQRQALTASSC